MPQQESTKVDTKPEEQNHPENQLRSEQPNKQKEPERQRRSVHSRYHPVSYGLDEYADRALACHTFEFPEPDM